MRLRPITFLAFSSLIIQPVWAVDKVSQDDLSDQTRVDTTTQQVGSTDTQMPGVVQSTTSVTREEPEHGTLRDEVVGFKPQVGMLVFNDALGNNTSRAAGGLTLDANVLSGLRSENGAPYLGPSVGFIYSHLGSAGSNFFGTNSGFTLGDSGSNFFTVPLDLKAGYTIGKNVRLAAHGGGNLIYRSVSNSIAVSGPVSTTITTNNGSDVTVYPNVGGDLEFGFGRNVSLLLRPDWTITPNNSFFTGTVGLGFIVG